MYYFTAKKYAQIYYATKIVIFWAKTNWTLSGIQACLNIFFLQLQWKNSYLLFTHNLEKLELHRNSILTWKVDLSILFTLKLFLIKILNIIISLCEVWKKILDLVVISLSQLNSEPQFTTSFPQMKHLCWAGSKGRI